MYSDRRFDALSVRLFSNTADLARDAAREAAGLLQAAIRKDGEARAVLATGNSQIAFIGELARQDGVDWSRTTLFHMDEYLGMEAGHPASFRRWMKERVETVLSPGAFHYIIGDAWQPVAECERYEALLREKPIHLCCLGIGENGHLAFNDPPVADFEDRKFVKIVKLDEGCRRQQVGEGHFPSVEAVPQYAISLTIPALCSAQKVFAIAPEKRKALAVRDALTGPIATQCPASYLRTQKQATLFLDEESSSLLPAA